MNFSPGFNPGGDVYNTLSMGKDELYHPHFQWPIRQDGYHDTYKLPIKWYISKTYNVIAYVYKFEQYDIHTLFLPSTNELLYVFFDANGTRIADKRINVAELQYNSRPTTPTYDIPYNTTQDPKHPYANNTVTSDIQPGNWLDDISSVLELSDLDKTYFHQMLDIYYHYKASELARTIEKSNAVKQSDWSSNYPHGMTREQESEFIIEVSSRPLWQLWIVVFFIQIKLYMYIAFLPRQWDIGTIIKFYNKYVQEIQDKQQTSFTDFEVYLHHAMARVMWLVQKFQTVPA